MMIIPVTCTTAKTCLRLRAPNCGSLPESSLDWFVRVQRVHCPVPPPPFEPRCQPPCWVLGDAPPCPPKPQPPMPAIDYPVFDVDDDGRVCFYWDDKLLTAEPGRYNATVYAGKRSETVVARFQIDLRCGDLMIDQAVSIEANPCGDCIDEGGCV